jgi:hypothetical protein
MVRLIAAPPPFVRCRRCSTRATTKWARLPSRVEGFPTSRGNPGRMSSVAAVRGGATIRDGGPMNRAARAPLAVAVVLLGLLSAAPAGASDPRVPLPTPDPVMLDGYCTGFTVIVTYTQMNEYIIHQTTAPDGTTTLKITGYAQATGTNLATGKSVTYTISGPGTMVLYPDGAFSIDAGGPNLLWTLPENSFPGVPTISFTTGHVTVQVDASGQTTAYSLRGNQTDVCAVLAS